MKKILNEWREYLNEVERFTPPWPGAYSPGGRLSQAELVAKGREGVGDPEKECLRRFNAPHGYTGGPIEIADREDSVTGTYQIIDRDDARKFQRIGRQDIDAARCDSQIFNGDRYLIYKFVKVDKPRFQSPHMRDKDAQPTWKERSDKREEGSIYGTEQHLIESFDDLDEAKDYEQDFAKSVGGKEVTGAGNTIRIFDREEDEDIQSRSRAPEEEIETEETAFMPENRKLTKRGLKKLIKEELLKELNK